MTHKDLEAALGRLEARAKMERENPDDFDPFLAADLSLVLSSLRGVMPKPIERAPKGGRFLAYGLDGWEQISRYDGADYVHVESRPEHCDEEPIEQFTAWLPLDALPKPEGGE